MIIGGGEGATAREVLKWPDVEQVDMYEWDKDVVSLFSTKYPQWAKGAWENPKLSIHYEDIFETIRCYPSFFLH
jgi:spermidine synthase